MIESRDIAVLAPPANLTSANQRRWLTVQQSQVNGDALRTVVGAGRDILVGSPLIGAVFAFALVKSLQNVGILGSGEADILKGLVVTGPFVDAIGKVGSLVAGIKGG